MSSKTGIQMSSRLAKIESDKQAKKAGTVVKIYGTAYSQVANGVNSTAQIRTEVTADGIAVKMTDGTVRTLLSPKEPILTLSVESADLIKDSKRVVVSFSVNAAGTVVPDSMRITPSSLPYKIDMELKKQIAQWRFAKAQHGGAVSFIFTLDNN